MTNLQAQYKAFWALACLLCFWAYKPALAQETYQEPAMAEPNTTQTAEPTPAYSKENPFANSQYTDLADLTELLIKQGYEVGEYFYSEGFTTGTDGVLGNEYICIRDDTNQVYIGRSDVCVDRVKDSTYSYVQIDKMDWTSGFPDQIVMQTGDLLGDTAQYWDGCYTLNQGWGGLSGGECPTINENYPGADYSTQINFGYVQQTLTNLAAINIALEEAGVEATGYNYSWSVKNTDAGYTNDGNGERTPDTFYVEVVIRDTEGNAVFSKTYDYSRYIEQWTDVSGEETFKDPFDANTLESIQLNVTGKDLGYWAGYYGPEFANPSIKLNYRYTGNPAAKDTTVEDTLLTSQCIADPLYDPACPGYNNAVIAQIASTNTIDDINSGADIGVPNFEEDTTNTGISSSQFAESSTFNEENSSSNLAFMETDTSAQSGMSQETAPSENTTQTNIDTETNQQKEIAKSPTQDSNQSITTTTLSSTQLSVLNSAQSISTSAEATASNAATTSAGSGLNESGGVSSELTSVDPTGSTTSTGQIAINLDDSSANDQMLDGSNTASTNQLQSNSSSLLSASIEQDVSLENTQQLTTNSTVDQQTTVFNQFEPNNQIIIDYSTTESNTQQTTIGNAETNNQIAADFSNPALDDQPYMDFNNTDANNLQTASSMGMNSGNSNNNSQDTNSTTDFSQQQTDQDVLDQTAEIFVAQQLDVTDITSTGSPQFDVSIVEQSVVQSANQTGQNSADSSIFESQLIDKELVESQSASFANDTSGFIAGNVVDEIVLAMTQNLIQTAVDEAEEVAEESSEQSYESQNAKEDELVEAAQNGSDDEDAQAALLGYNPNFRAYQQEQMKDGDIYSSQGMYENQKTYDNPNARFFNGASDATHRAMIRQQYNLEN